MHEALKVRQRAQLWLDRRVTAVLAADRPRAAGVAGLRHQRVVATFAVGSTDGVDRREVDDVEAQLRQSWQLALRVLERAVDAGSATLGTWEELVPRTEERALAVYRDLEHAVVARDRSRIEVLGHDGAQLHVERLIDALRNGHVLGCEQASPVTQSRLGYAGRAFHRPAHDGGAFEQFGRDVQSRVRFLLQFARPGREHIGPGFHGELPASHLVQRKEAVPAVLVVIIA